MAAEKRSRKKLMELKQVLSTVINESGVGLERLFRSFDTNRDGEVDEEELKTGLAALGGGKATYERLFYETAAGEAVEAVSTAKIMGLVGSGDITPETLVWAEGMEGWTPWDGAKQLFVGGAAISDQQVTDIFAILDKDGDGAIDYQEFARWFGNGPPPPPMLPEVKLRMDAQAAAGDAGKEHLDAIQAAAEKRSRKLMMNLKRELAGVFKMSGVALEQQFRGFDANGDGIISADEFRNGLLSLGAQISEEQIADLVMMLDNDGDGIINYQEFGRWFGSGAPPPPMMPDMKMREEARQEAHAAFDPAEHLKAIQSAAEKRSRGLLLKLKQELAGVFDASGVSLERQFRGFDTDGDGAIDHDEFKNGLLSLGANISEGQIDDLVMILDKDGDGEIDYQEFARWFGRGAPPPPMLPQAKAAQEAQAERAAGGFDGSALLREIEAAGRSRKPPPPPTPEMMARVQAKESSQSSGSVDPNAHLNAIHEAAQAKAEKRSRTLMLQLKSELSGMFTMSGVSLEQQFRGFDTDGDGAIDRSEFVTGLSSLGANLPEDKLEDLLTILDSNGTGTIDYAEFARWFGAGPPPPPMMPEMKAREDARAESSFDTADLLAEIEAAGLRRLNQGMASGGGPPPPPPMAAGMRGFVPAPPPPVPEGMFSAGSAPPQAYGNSNSMSESIRIGAEKRSRTLMLQLKQELAGIFNASGVDLERQFRGFDTDGDGSIDHDEFTTGLRSLGATLPPEKVGDLLIILDKDGDGTIDYAEFARWFGNGPPPPPMLPEMKMRLDAQAAAGDAGKEHLDAIQAAAEKRSRKLMMNLKRELAGVFKMSGVALEQQFRGFDANGDGIISADEFRNGLLSLGAQISEEQIADLVMMLDNDGDGIINYQEFGRWFGSGAPPPPMMPDMKMREEARQEAHAAFDPAEHLKAIQSAAEKRSRGLLLKLKQELAGVFDASGVSLERQFRGFDTDGDGAIDHDEFKNGLLSLGANISEGQIDDLVMILDKDGDGEIDYQEFARWFGRGAPPPPMLPQAKAAQEAQAERAAGGFDGSALLREIEAAGRSRKPPPPPTPEMMARVQAKESATTDTAALLREIEAAAAKRGGGGRGGPPPAPPPPPPIFGGGGPPPAPPPPPPIFGGGPPPPPAGGGLSSIGQQQRLLGEIAQAGESRQQRAFLSEIETKAQMMGGPLAALAQVQQGSNPRADLLADIEAAAKKYGTGGSAAEFVAEPGNAALLREIEAAAQRRSASASGGGMSSLMAEISQGPGKSGLRAAAPRSMGNAELLQEIQNAGARRQAVPQAEGVAATVLQAMSAHPSNGGVQLAGCSALWSLAYKNPYNRAAMGQQGESLTEARPGRLLVVCHIRKLHSTAQHSTAQHCAALTASLLLAGCTQVR